MSSTHDERAERPASSADWSSLFEKLPQCIGIYSALRDEQRRIVDFQVECLNDAARRSHDVPRAAQGGQRLSDVVPSHRESGLFDAFRRVVETGEPFADEWFECSDDRHAQPHTRLFHVHAQRHGDGVVATWRDVTRAADELRHDEHWFRDMADTAPAMLWVTDEQHRCTFLNRGWFEFTGQSETEGRGFGWMNAIHPDDRERATKYSINAGERQASFQIDYRLRRADGQYRWTIDAARPRFGPDGEFRGYVGCVIDIHERKESEEAVRAAYALIEGITSGTEDLIASQDADYRYTFFNEAYRREFRRLWGRELSVGMSMLEALAAWPDEMRKAQGLWSRALGGESFGITTEFGPTSQDVQTYDLRFNPVRNQEGRIVGAAHILRNITDQVRLQRAIEEREANIRSALEAVASEQNLLRTILDQLPVGVMVTDRGGKTLVLNRALAEMKGDHLQLDTIEGYAKYATWWDDSGEQLEVEDWPIVRALRTGQPQASREVHVLRSNGSRGVMRVSAAPLISSEGEIAGAVAMAEDVTARRESEQSLRESEERFRHTFENAAVGIALVDIDGTWLRLNSRYCEIVGYDHDELLARTFQDITHPDDLGADLAKFESMMRGEISSYQMEKRYIHKDGRDVWILLTKALQRDENGEPHYCISVVQDIGARKRAEEALQKSEARSRLAQQVGGVGTFEWDIRRNVNVWSPELEVLYGIEPGSFKGTYEAWADLVHPEDLERAEADVLKSLESGELESEWRVKWGRGDVRWLASRGWIEHDAKGNPIRMIGVNVDITHRKRQEERLKTVMAELNHRVKNTLAVIQAIATQTMRQAENLRTFKASFEQRLQSIAMAHALLTKTDWKGVSLDEIVSSEIGLRDMPSNRFSISGPPMTLSPNKALAMHLVIHELTTNAYKYGGLSQDSGRVDVAWRVDDEQSLLHLDWKEESPGPVREPERTGYGSRLIRQVVDYELGGTIDREFGERGFRCRIQVPLSERGMVVRAYSPQDRPSGDVKARVLVVEDTLALAMTMCDELEADGYAIMGPAATLAEGEALVESAAFDLAVLDVDLHGAKSYAIARRLRERSIPFVLLTGYSASDLPEDLQDSWLLSKPVSMNDLKAFLSAHREQEDLDVDLVEPKQACMETDEVVAPNGSNDKEAATIRSMIHDVNNMLAIVGFRMRDLKRQGADADTVEAIDKEFCDLQRQLKALFAAVRQQEAMSSTSTE
jgi:PAS domain S-box-containing protein